MKNDQIYGVWEKEFTDGLCGEIQKQLISLERIPTVSNIIYSFQFFDLLTIESYLFNKYGSDFVDEVLKIYNKKTG